MILITSAAYVEGDFSAEVGLLPPSFLPVGNKRLYHHQIKLFEESSKSRDLYLSIPSSFSIDPYDEKQIDELGINILRVPDGLSLGDSILYCWNATARHHDTLTVLHGDTLFLNFDLTSSDAVSVHKNRGYYMRARVGSPTDVTGEFEKHWSNNDERVLSGFFSFKNPLFFMKSLVELKGDFEKAIGAYNGKFSLATLGDGLWLDFGHINSYFNARRVLTTERFFNELKITDRFVEKKSCQNQLRFMRRHPGLQTCPCP